MIFDLDGVLIDSYDAHFQSWRQLAIETGVQFSEADFAASFGRTSRDVIRRHWPAAADDQDLVQRLDDRKESLFRAQIQRDFPSMDGAIELIDALSREQWPMAVGSSAPPANVDLVLDALQRRSVFWAVVTGADVSRGKPDPQVFLLAANRLGIEPERCVVIEDAPPGIEAARAAGMKSVALLSTGRAPSDFVRMRPDLTVSSLRELSPSVLRRIFQGARQSARG